MSREDQLREILKMEMMLALEVEKVQTKISKIKRNRRKVVKGKGIASLATDT